MTKRAPAKKARSKKTQPEKPMIVLGPGQRMQLVGPIVLRGGTLEIGPSGYVNIIDVTPVAPNPPRGKKRR